ncbi:hypothetical protein KPSA1_03730 [Pseudomonas syringae pv. actinidiae]|uniref:Uncharacterized protein n=1 Tax=Pseudomonas syringae pv. actinidiae TaxID=103796 RepID=A0A2V0R601_PSESF|nr:hypothetical protein KPSA1_03730 [Pseudomonas syringae pv. actinidiae]GBH17885.1 hypothetical protein KPSA3_03861 [Pseudomonas syringae pv. actinidiae]
MLTVPCFMTGSLYKKNMRSDGTGCLSNQSIHKQQKPIK